jgi:hypothetical protein
MGGKLMAVGTYDDTGFIALILDAYEAETLSGWLAQIVDEFDMSAEQAGVLSGILDALNDTEEVEQ